jgi:cytochrome c553
LHKRPSRAWANPVRNSNPQLELAAAVLRETESQMPAVMRGQTVVMGTSPCAMGRICFSCFQCHGIPGEGTAAAPLPRLAGQDDRYLNRSLEDFASGARESATMRELAQALTQQQRRDRASQGGPAYPYLAGQHAQYLEQQLEQFRAGTRRGPDAQVMQVIARGLTTEQARAVSVHFASQAPPRSSLEEMQP